MDLNDAARSQLGSLGLDLVLLKTHCAAVGLTTCSLFLRFLWFLIPLSTSDIHSFRVCLLLSPRQICLSQYRDSSLEHLYIP